MIVSFARNFVFVKTEKTAGTTIELALTPLCADGDILTPLDPEDEVERQKGAKVEARNFSPRDPQLEVIFRRAMIAGDATTARRIIATLRESGLHFYNHMTAKEAQAMLLADFWGSAIKITAVRHPYERMVSAISFFTGGEAISQQRFDELYEDFGATIAADRLRYMDGDRLLVDETIRHEHLGEDLARVFARLGAVWQPDTLPAAKTGYRRDRRPAREILSRAQRRRLQRLCEPEFKAFGYEP